MNSAFPAFGPLNEEREREREREKEEAMGGSERG
jgi:hypothetical protein